MRRLVLVLGTRYVWNEEHRPVSPATILIRVTMTSRSTSYDDGEMWVDLYHSRCRRRRRRSPLSRRPWNSARASDCSLIRRTTNAVKRRKSRE